MKLKSRKMISALVAAFLVVVLAGSAFAFGTGTLTFGGTAYIQQNLNVNIDEAVFVRPGWEYTISPDRQSVTFNVPVDLWTLENWQTFDFRVENTGTLPAQLAPSTYLFVCEDGYPLLNGSDFIQFDLNTNYRVIQPGARGFVSSRFRFVLPEDFDGMYINETINFVITVNYTWHNPLAP